MPCPLSWGRYTTKPANIALMQDTGSPVPQVSMDQRGGAVASRSSFDDMVIHFVPMSPPLPQTLAQAHIMRGTQIDAHMYKFLQVGNVISIF